MRIGALTLFTLLIISSCTTSLNFNRTLVDEKIDNGIRQKILNLDKQVITAFEENKPDLIWSICSDKLLDKSRADFPAFIQKMQRQISSANYTPHHQYYIRNTSENVNTILPPDETGKRKNQIRFVALNEESVATLGFCKDDYHTVAILTIYGLYESGWKINVLHIGETEILGMDAIDWYEKARVAYNKGALVDAVNIISVVDILIRPFKDYLSYKEEDDIKKFRDKISTEIYQRHQLPLPLTKVSTRPSVFKVSPLVLSTGYHPIISYASNIKQSDTIALARECDIINSQIGKIFNGINTYNDSIFYRAYDGLPEAGKQSRFYGLIRSTISK